MSRVNLAQSCGVRLVGGDTTRGPLSLTLTVFGRVPAGQALTRSGAQPGDLLRSANDRYQRHHDH